MTLCIHTEPTWDQQALLTADAARRNRILAALGPLGRRSPAVGEKTLLRYYQYLLTHLALPFTAFYPAPTSALEQVSHRLTVVELLDPVRYIYDEFDGLYCKTRHARFETNLPLVELKIPEDNPGSQLIEDYWFWFWYWR
ncbi:MAG: calcium-binding protein [Thermoguttaceae bacterium]